jgi:SAM-dependent methyltransferase
MDYKTIIDSVNRRAYTSRAVLSWYKELDVFPGPEQAILEEISPLIKNKRLLDIAIGAGRTTKRLLGLSRDYVGIDYAPDMVEAAKGRYPEASILCRDARDLADFNDASFDFVLAAANCLDYMVHEERITVLKEIRRVLGAGGLFMFSTHNRDYQHFDRLPWQQGISFDLNFIKNCVHGLCYFPQHLRLKKHAVHRDRYAVINANGHGYSLLTYYISINHQVEQLKESGFAETRAYGFGGLVQGSETNSPWIYYLTRKSAD